MMEMNPLKQIYTDFVKILEQSVIKYKYEGEKYETLEMKKAADLYIKAVLQQDSFATYFHYDRKVISTVMGLTDENDISYYQDNRDEIPFKYRTNMLLFQRKYIVDNYEEKNNYYRMLNGKPDIEDNEKIFVDTYYTDNYNIPNNVPIYELTDSNILTLESLGYIDNLIKQYPDKKYLKFLGNKRIDIVTARTANNFAVIRIPYSLTETMWDYFSLIYEQCREYFMTCIYIGAYRDTIDYYDNFIALCIMVMTITQIVSRVIKSTIERNFFDEYCVRLLFSVYGVPYFEYMDTNTRRQIVQNLNILVLNKGTNKVLYDIASILGYDRIKIYKYYLMKSQKWDINNMPVVVYKTDPTTGEQVYDYEKMFDIYFQKVEIKDMDTYKSLLVNINKMSYEQITQDDPFWVDDDALMKEMYESEYNFVETKYLGVSISYRLTRILFENAYLLRMLLDKKDEIPGIRLDLPKISDFNSISLFDSVVLLCALVCKQNHLSGNILTRPSQILHVIGFNFNEDFEAIRQEILLNPYLEDRLANFLKDSHTYTAERVNELYKDMVNLFDELVEIMSTTNNIEVYDACNKLYKTLFFTDENQTIFNIGTNEKPQYATTFLEYLQYKQPMLYQFINDVDIERTHQYINHICNKIMNIIPDLKYLGIFSERSETTETMLVELIKFFKSYTTDMIGLNILYIFDVKPELLLRLIDHITIHKTIQPEDDLHLPYADNLTFTSRVQYESYLKWLDKIHYIHNNLWIFDTLKFMDIFSKFTVNLLLGDKEQNDLRFFDLIQYMNTDLYIQDCVYMKELIQIYTKFNINDKFSFDDFMTMIVNISFYSNIELYDIIEIMSSFGLIDKSFNLNDNINYHITLMEPTKLLFSNKIHYIHKNGQVVDDYSMTDIIQLLSRFNIHDTSILSKDDYNIKIKNTLWSLMKNFYEKIHYINKDLGINGIYNMMDIINILNVFTIKDNTLKIYDKFSYLSKLITKDNLNEFKPVINAINKNIRTDDEGQYIDFISFLTKLNFKDSFGFKDTCKISYI